MGRRESNFRLSARSSLINRVEGEIFIQSKYSPHKFMNLDKNLIPDEINTVERLAGWCLSILARTSVNLRYQEVENGPMERVITASPFTSGEDDFRFGFRGGLRLSPDYLSDKTSPLYMHIVPMVEAQIPASFLKQAP